MKKSIIFRCLLFAITIIAISCLIFLILNMKKNDILQEDNNKIINKASNLEKEEINEIKNKTNALADTEMYEIKEEYDGRKIIEIKPSIQFETALAGAMKGGKPEENEINELINEVPKKNGIWIPKESRKKAMEILDENNLQQFKIDEEGYLYTKENKGDKNFEIIKNLISKKNLYIIEFSGLTYIRDEITGIIVENPFEEMDESQILEIYTNENIMLIEVIKNENKRFSDKEILNEILLNM